MKHLTVTPTNAEQNSDDEDDKNGKETASDGGSVPELHPLYRF